MIKSRARVGVRTEWRVRSTGRGECRSSVRRTCDCSGAGRAVKCASNEGSVKSVVSAKSGWSGACG